MPKYDWKWPDSQIVRVIDGDTFIARVTRSASVGPIDIGFHGSATMQLTVPFEQRLRLDGINTPKVTTKRGQRAKEVVQSLTENQLVHIVTAKPYKYGDEWMAKVTLPDGTDLTSELIRLKLGTSWDGKGKRPNDDL